MANPTTKEKIELLTESEWEELSLRETLSAEEALCDVADLQFMAETADLPKSDKDLAGFIKAAEGEFDHYQFFNQDQLSGLSTEDAEDLTDPDRKNAGLNEEIHTLDKTNKEMADMTDPNKNVASNDLPPVTAVAGMHKDIEDEDGTKDSVTEQPVNESSDYLSMLLGEGTDGVGNNDTVVDDSDMSDMGEDDGDDEDMADFDEEAFISDINGL
jgi:hypothetical protein